MVGRPGLDVVGPCVVSVGVCWAVGRPEGGRGCGWAGLSRLSACMVVSRPSSPPNAGAMWLTLCACVVHGTPLHHHRYVALRHGQSEANVQGIISSEPRVAVAQHGLSASGRAQAQRARRARRVARFHPPGPGRWRIDSKTASQPSRTIARQTLSRAGEAAPPDHHGVRLNQLVLLNDVR